MNDAERRLIGIASRQRQVFTRRQALEAGLSSTGVYRRLDSGLFVPVGPHTMTLVGVTLDWRSQLQAGLLDLGLGALVSAEAAAALHGLDGFAVGPLVYLVPRSRRRRTTVGAVTSTHDVAALDRCTVDGLVVTSCTRTVVELLARVGPDEVGNALDSGTRKRLTAPAVVARRLAELGRQGRAGVADFDAVMRLAGVESWLERRFLRLLQGSGIPAAVVQRTYRADGAHVARVDFDFAPADRGRLRLYGAAGRSLASLESAASVAT